MMLRPSSIGPPGDARRIDARSWSRRCRWDPAQSQEEPTASLAYSFFPVGTKLLQSRGVGPVQQRSSRASSAADPPVGPAMPDRGCQPPCTMKSGRWVADLKSVPDMPARRSGGRRGSVSACAMPWARHAGELASGEREQFARVRKWRRCCAEDDCPTLLRCSITCCGRGGSRRKAAIS